LSTCPDIRLLSNLNFTEGPEESNFLSRRVDKVMDFMMAHFQREISLAEVAAIANMSEVSFCKFFKRRTGLTFVECLLDIRLGHATRLLLNTTQTVSEIAYQCGFNNISNFNRYFKRRKNCTPSMFRESYYQRGVRSIL
jgi:AraC-like DNA-binding protein